MPFQSLHALPGVVVAEAESVGAEQFSADCPTASADASSFRRDLGVALLMSSVTVLALAVKSLWHA